MTEPDAGLDTARIKTRAERLGDRYVVHGAMVWISTAQNVLLRAQTPPLADCRKPIEGLSLFYTTLDRARTEAREEWILIAAEALGIGRSAAYARERVRLDRPIGKNQAIQHPLPLRGCNLRRPNS